MKKKIITALVSCMTITFIFAGCGKKNNSVADNLVKDDPSKIQNMDQYAGLATTKESAIEEQPGEIVDTISVNTVSSDTISNNSVSADTISSNGVSDNSLSENSISDNEETPSQSLSDITSENVYVPAENNTLNISNISGRNLSAVYVTFSEGNLKGSEILGNKKLKDGNIYTYTIDDMESLRNGGILKLSITAIDNKEKDINFGEIDIVDPNNMTIVLAHDKNGYYLYQY